MRHIFLTLISLAMCLPAMGQRDTVVTRLHEVAVVGMKQSAESDMSAVTTVDQATIQRLNIATMKGVSELAPNFYMPDYGSRITSSIYVRGLGARIDQPAVGLSVDGVSYVNKNNYDFDLFDIGEIEVFRGAQSILNGRNTMCGQVNITTLSPWRYNGWRLMAEYGRYNTMRFAAGYYGKLSPTLATSVTAYYTATDGFFRNEYNGKKLDHERQGTARWKLSWHPTDRVTVTNTASLTTGRQGGYPYQSVATGMISHDDTCYYRRTSFADGLTVGFTGKRVVVTSVTSLQTINDDMTLDQDFLPLPYFTLTQKTREWAVTEDLYAKHHMGRFDWLGGVFGMYKHMRMDAPVTFKDMGISELIEKHPNEMNPQYPIEWDTRSFVLGSDFGMNTRSGAVYLQSSYNIGKWDFEVGLRWDIENTTLDYHSQCNTGYTIWHKLPDGTREVFRHSDVDINDGGHLSRTFNELLPKLTVGYTFSPDVRMYVNVTKGYKAGGFNTQMFSDVLQQRVMALMGLSMKYDVDEIVGYKPEKSWNYELGIKTALPDQRLALDGTLFYISCTDQQLTTFPDGTTTGRIMTNAGRTRSFGLEATARYAVNADLGLRASYGYTNATFLKYHNGQADFRGKHLPYAPSNTLFVGANYVLPFSIAGVRPSVDVNVRGIGQIYWNEANTLTQPFYALLGASLAYERPHWSIRLWGENLTSTRYYTFYFLSMGNEFVQRARPLSAGATLRINL